MRLVTSRLVTLVLLLSLTLPAACSLQQVDPSRESGGLIPFESSFLGIRGVAPAGWTETYPGTFRRVACEGDFTTLVQRSYRSIDTLSLMEATVFFDGSPLGDLPEASEMLDTSLASWSLYEVSFDDFDGRRKAVDLALSQVGEDSHVVILVSDPEERSQLRKSVFLPAIREVNSCDAPAESSIREDNLYRFAYNEDSRLDVRETRRSTADGITEIHLTYLSPSGERVPTILMIPEGVGPFPGIVFQHGFPSNRFGIRSLALQHAQIGAVCIMIDAPWARPDRAGRSYPFTFTEVDYEEQIQLIIDLRRAVDLLLGLPEVDPDQLAYVGASFGGGVGGLLAGVESRLQAYVLIVGGGGLMAHFFGLEDVVFPSPQLTDPEVQQAWVEVMWPIEAIHYVGYAAPAALLFQNGRADVAVPVPEAIAYQSAGSDPKTIQWYDAGHNLTNSTFDDHVEWLSQFITYSR